MEALVCRTVRFGLWKMDREKKRESHADTPPRRNQIRPICPVVLLFQLPLWDKNGLHCPLRQRSLRGPVALPENISRRLEWTSNLTLSVLMECLPRLTPTTDDNMMVSELGPYQPEPSIPASKTPSEINILPSSRTPSTSPKHMLHHSSEIMASPPITPSSACLFPRWQPPCLWPSACFRHHHPRRRRPLRASWPSSYRPWPWAA